MKMQRSHNENENVQFVQELAEVDGPFESPININFRDLTKLELPSLVWNRSDSSPKKMKITNTGHTVIISGKWKCERPYLTGGPLQGKYVFSQIHFHWGQDDCRGSEHQVCGQGFPLEMHVAHFKTDYLTQEGALREKDGMVVVVYFFKLQEEPNASLKKILTSLPHIQQPSTSHPLDPRPILSLCNPFTDDYFMYWGSVVTSTCAHILLWLVCREPFGISKEQVNEFRKILDASQQPIQRNNRDTQPLHKRNVFHVNASKNLADPLLPVKKILGCFCKKSEDNVSVNSPPHDCSCQAYLKNQEDIEERSTPERWFGFQCEDNGGNQALNWSVSLPKDFLARQSIFVHNAAVHSAPQISKKFEDDPIRHTCCLDSETRSEDSSNVKLVSQSCCFFPMKEVSKIKTRPEKKRKPFNSLRAFSHILDSLEALKKHTFKKLKEIESINQEIKGMQRLCEEPEETRWIRRIEKMMTRQKRFTVRTSQACFSELKKLAKECNFDKFFDNKALSEGDNNKILWVNNKTPNQVVPCTEVYIKKEEETCEVEKVPSKSLELHQAVKFSVRAQKLIQSFFEDIKESEGIQNEVKKNIELKKISSLCSKQGGDADSLPGAGKGLITQKMFNLGNLGPRFFTEVTAEDIPMNGWGDREGGEEGLVEAQSTDSFGMQESEKIRVVDIEEAKISSIKEEVIPLHRANVAIGLTRTRTEKLLMYEDPFIDEKPPKLPPLHIPDTSTSDSEVIPKTYTPKKPIQRKKSVENSEKREMYSFTREKFLKNLDANEMLNKLHHSTSNFSLKSAETQRMIIAKFHKRQSRKDIWRGRSSTSPKISSKCLHEKRKHKKHKMKNFNIEGYYMKKESMKNKRTRGYMKRGTSSCGVSSTSLEDLKMNKPKWKRLAKAKFKLQIQKSTDSTLESAIEYSLVSPERKKLKLEYKRIKGHMFKKRSFLKQGIIITETSITESDTLIESPYKTAITRNNIIDQVNAEEDEEWECQRRIRTPESEKKKTLTNFHTPRTESREGTRPSTHRTFRASSADSRTTYSERQETEKPEHVSPPDIKHETSRKDTQTHSPPRLLTKIKSLSNLITKPKIYLAENTHRFFVENINDRRKTPRDISELRKKTELPKRKKESPRVIIRQELSRGASNETYSKSDKEKEEREAQEYNVGFFTTPSKQVDEELLPINQFHEDKYKTQIMKINDFDKYHFLDKPFQDHKPPPEEEKLEIVQVVESTKSFINDTPNMKGDADPAVTDNAELPTSVSFTIKKNGQSRPHSAESLHSSVRVLKRKGKKRPHCCKRSSRHYIRKNSSIFRKPNKVESKPLSLAGLTEDEQLQIISVNVAKYLKQKLVENPHQLSGENCSLKELQEVVMKNIKESDDKPITQKKNKGETREKGGIPVLKAAPRLVKKEKPIKKDQPEELKPAKEPEKEIKNPSGRPVSNFIKLNKQMAGKYKRMRTPPVEKKPEDLAKKTEEEKPKPQSPKSKTKAPSKKKKENFSEAKRSGTPKADSPPPNRKPEKKNQKPKSPKESPPKSPKTPRKPGPASKSLPKEAECPPTEAPEPRANGGDGPEDNPPPSLALQKIPQGKKRWVPAYMVTSYLPAPIEIVENQQRKMNRYLPNMKNGNMGSYLPEVLCDSQNIKANESETVFKKDLEYLIKLQMCINNEISTNLENSMNYVKTLLSQSEHSETAIIETPPANDSLDVYDPSKKSVVLIEMNEHCSSSSSEFAEDSVLFCKSRKFSSKYKLKDKDISKIQLPKESGDSGILNPVLIRELEGQEGYNSDSSYNCEISITLNAGASEGEGELQVYDPAGYLGEYSNYTYDLWRESNFSQTTTHLDGRSSSQSVVLRQHRKKRKDNDISTEMKQKLLEILEGEINREMAATYGLSSENSSEGLALTWEDYEGTNKSPSVESNSDNQEVIAQISETMRQYLCDFKERNLAEEGETEGEDAP